MSANIDITVLHKNCKAKKESIFISILYFILSVSNQIENFRMHYKNGDLVLFEKINGGTTLFYEDGSFGFAYYDFDSDKTVFSSKTANIIEKARLEKSFEPRPELIDLIHFSAIPWISFTSFKHAQDKHINSSIPRITTGKIFEQGDQILLPLSVEVNHAIMDGFHVGQFYEMFQLYCMECD